MALTTDLEAVELFPVQRLALAYAPRSARHTWTGLLALDTRLEEAAPPGREPIAVQLRLAWWRDRFAEPAARWPRGEPLLELLQCWDNARGALGGLVDGWESASVGEPEADGHAALAHARIEAMMALAGLLGVGDDGAIRVAARDWVMPGEAGMAPTLPRAMRPLAVLRALAVREARYGGRRPVSDLAAAMRVGLIGR